MSVKGGKGGEIVATDGPFAETKEVLAERGDSGKTPRSRHSSGGR